MRKKVLLELPPDVYNEFKSVVILDGKTVRATIEKLMKDYIRRKNASRTKNSRTGWNH